MFDRNWFSRQRPPAAEGRTGQDAAGPRSSAPPRQADYDLEDADLDDEDDEDFDDEAVSGPDPARPGEMFWALRDVSLQVPHGSALGVWGGQGAAERTMPGTL